MPIEAATFISQLVPTDPLQTDPIQQGQQHIGLIKQVLQNQFPNLGTAAVTGTAAALNAAAGQNATAGTLEVSANGATGGQLVLDGPAGAGSVILSNTATSGQGGSLTITSFDHTNTTPTTLMTIDASGNATLAGFITAAIIKQAGFALLPAGVIVKWSGSAAAVPGGYHLCDGTNGTPDLRDKFVVGAGLSFAVAQTGGAASQTVATNVAGSP
jgi:hypothetical protein